MLLSCSYVFAELADEVTDGDTQRFDEWVLKSLRRADDPAVPIGPPWLREAAMDATALGSPLVLTLVVVAVAGLIGIKGQHRIAWIIILTAIGGRILEVLLKSLIGRERPIIVPPLREVTTPSFPSGHAMLSAIVYLSIGTILMRTVEGRRAKTYCLLWAMFLPFVVGVSRIYLGVHYPTDVLGGWIAGLAWALACWIITQFVPTSNSSAQPTTR